MAQLRCVLGIAPSDVASCSPRSGPSWALIRLRLDFTRVQGIRGCVEEGGQHPPKIRLTTPMGVAGVGATHCEPDPPHRHLMEWLAGSLAETELWRCARRSRPRWSSTLTGGPDSLVEGAAAGCETERLGGLEIDHQLELGRLLDGQIGGLGAFENLINESGRSPIRIGYVGPIGYEAAIVHVFSD